jgi:hypothetical protein
MNQKDDYVPLTVGMFILDGHQAVPTESWLEWHKCFRDSEKRIVGRTEIGKITISTVFLGMDHGWGPRSEGLVFETMVFGYDGNENMTTRYRTWEEAENGHKRIVEEMKAL